MTQNLSDVIARAVRMQQCKFWTVPLLQDLGDLRKVKYIIPEMEADLRSRVLLYDRTMTCIENELAEADGRIPREFFVPADTTENVLLAWKDELEQFQRQEVFIAPCDHVGVEQTKPSFRLMATSMGSYYSPKLIVQEQKARKMFIMVAELRENEQFLDDIVFLKEHFKSDYEIYYEGKDRHPAAPVFYQGQIRKLLEQEKHDALVSTALITNAKKMRKEIPYYQAAYQRRHAFAQDVKKYVQQTTYANEDSASRAVREHWAQELCNAVYECIQDNPVVCQLMNGQSVGTFRMHRLSDTFEPLFSPDAYVQNTLEPERFSRWIRSYHAVSDIEFAVEGKRLHIDRWASVQCRLDEHAKELYKQRLLDEDDYLAYCGAAHTLATVFNDELLKFSAKKARAPIPLR